jgi:hypothetical protein
MLTPSRAPDESLHVHLGFILTALLLRAHQRFAAAASRSRFFFFIHLFISILTISIIHTITFLLRVACCLSSTQQLHSSYTSYTSWQLAP